jgi:membrane peptidoglycan carboxypeptidase
MSPRRRHRSAALARLAMAVVVAGVLLAALLLPWVAGSGVVARDLASTSSGLSMELDDLPRNTQVLAADGSLITEFYTDNRTPVPGDQIADVMKQAQVDIEDARFYEHNGLDLQGTVRALVRNVAAGTVEQGGSTLTQQLVKQTLLQTADTAQERQAATEESVGRKVREARLALALEQRYSKDQILTQYLNLVYFGQGAYGVQAAAQRYFGVDARDLSLPQAATLAGLVQSPANDDPVAHPDAARTRRDEVLNRMHQLGHVSDQELADAVATPIDVTAGRQPPNGCIDATIGGNFCAYLYDYLTGPLGLTQDQVVNGSLVVHTTLRPDMQVAGDQAVLKVLPMGDRLAGIYTAVEPGTGHVLAMSTNRRYGCSDPDCESVVLNTAYSQGSGSTYKVFTAAAALDRGYRADFTLTTSNPYVSRVFRDNGGPYVVRAFAAADKPTLTMEQALYMSSNTYFVALEDVLGSVEGPVRMAERMGMHFVASTADQIIGGNRGSFTLGAEATSPLDLASAYSTIAAAGTRCDPTPVTQVLDRRGEPVTHEDGSPVDTGDSCHPDAVPRAVATTLAQMMRKDVEPGYPGQTGTNAYVPAHQIAGKTGTAQDGYSISFGGFTPQYSASVMVFNPKQSEDVGTGSGTAAGIWHDALAPVLTGQPVVPFPPADPALAGRITPPGPPPAS